MISCRVANQIAAFAIDYHYVSTKYQIKIGRYVLLFKEPYCMVLVSKPVDVNRMQKAGQLRKR